jgi:superoxide dismutase, Fe-Mn family
MENLTRREALTAALTTGSGLLLSSTNFAENLNSTGQETSEGSAFSGSHTPKPLPYSFGKLKGLSERLVKSHWENNYSGAVKALNAVETKLTALIKDKDFSPNLYGAYKREQLTRAGSIVLHEKYFGNLGGNGKASGEISSAINKSFGSFDTWETEFRKTAMSLGGGSGWVVLSYNLHMGDLVTYWSWDHLTNLAAGYPLMVLDMYEHAYHIDYGTQAAKYIDAFMQNVNWEEVNRRYVGIKKARELL